MHSKHLFMLYVLVEFVLQSRPFLSKYWLSNRLTTELNMCYDISMLETHIFNNLQYTINHGKPLFGLSGWSRFFVSLKGRERESIYSFRV